MIVFIYKIINKKKKRKYVKRGKRRKGKKRHAIGSGECIVLSY